MKEENGAARELEWKKPLGREDRWILRVRSTYQEEQGMGEGTPGLSAGGQEELCGWCYQGIVMISWLSYFSLISPAPHFPFFSAGWPWGGEGHIRTAMALLQTVIYGRPAVCLSPHEIKDGLGRNTQPWGSRTVSSFLGLKMFYPTLPFCIMPG